MKTKNGYVCFFGSQRWECYAPTQWDAIKQAREHFKVSKSKQHLVSATLAERSDGTEVIHIAVD